MIEKYIFEENIPFSPNTLSMENTDGLQIRMSNEIPEGRQYKVFEYNNANKTSQSTSGHSQTLLPIIVFKDEKDKKHQCYLSERDSGYKRPEHEKGLFLVTDPEGCRHPMYISGFNDGTYQEKKDLEILDSIDLCLKDNGKAEPSIGINELSRTCKSYTLSISGIRKNCDNDEAYNLIFAYLLLLGTHIYFSDKKEEEKRILSLFHTYPHLFSCLDGNGPISLQGEIVDDIVRKLSCTDTDKKSQRKIFSEIVFPEYIFYPLTEDQRAKEGFVEVFSRIYYSFGADILGCEKYSVVANLCGVPTYPFLYKQFKGKNPKPIFLPSLPGSARYFIEKDKDGPNMAFVDFTPLEDVFSVAICLFAGLFFGDELIIPIEGASQNLMQAILLLSEMKDSLQRMFDIAIDTEAETREKFICHFACRKVYLFPLDENKKGSFIEYARLLNSLFSENYELESDFGVDIFPGSQPETEESPGYTDCISAYGEGGRAHNVRNSLKAVALFGAHCAYPCSLQAYKSELGVFSE